MIARNQKMLWFAVITVTCVLALPCAANQVADSPSFADHLVALISTSPNDESASVPVFASDVELQALLFLAIENGPSWTNKAVDAQARIRALRTVVLTRFLARAARQIGSDANSDDASKTREWLINQVGDQRSMLYLLERSGGSIVDLERWISDSLLAREQITYIKERLNPVSEEDLNAAFAAGGHPFEGSKLESVKHKFRRYLDTLRTQKEIQNLVGEAFKTGRVKFLK